MPTDLPAHPQPKRFAGDLPRAAWIGVGLLSLGAAGVAGAMIMRSADRAPIAQVAAATESSQNVRSVPDAAPAKPALQASKAATPNPSAVAQRSTPAGTAPVAACPTCGVVESVESVQQPGQATGLGAVAGGVLGGVVGHQMGGGNGKTAMTVLGAVGGGLAGNEVEKRARSETLFNVRVRMKDGSRRTFQHSRSLSVGAHVVVEGTKLRLAGAAAGA
jgi:outer membrane lipoprotein SlyB